MTGFSLFLSHAFFFVMASKVVDFDFLRAQCPDCQRGEKLKQARIERKSN